MVLHYIKEDGSYIFEQLNEPFYPLIYYKDADGSKWAHYVDDGYFECADAEFQEVATYQALTKCMCEFRDKVDGELMSKQDLSELTQAVHMSVESERLRLVSLEEMVYDTEVQLFDLMEDAYSSGKFESPYWRL